MWWTFLMRRKNPRGCHLWGFLVLMKTMIDIKKEAVWNSIQLHDLSGNRTRVYAVRGRRLDRLTNRPESRRQDSNLRPLRPERSALPNWATPRCSWAFVLCCSPATRIYYHDSGKNASVFLKKLQILKMSFFSIWGEVRKCLILCGKMAFPVKWGFIVTVHG